MRLDYIDGLRAIFAVSTVMMHMFFTMLPIGGVLHTDRTMHLQSLLDNAIGWIPLFRSSAYYGVCGFFFISAIVLSYRFWGNVNHEKLTSSAFRRYFRLTGPVLFSVLFAYFLVKCGWMRIHDVTLQVQSYPLCEQMYLSEPSLVNAIKEGVWGVYTAYNQLSSYNAVLWTMEVELKGSFLSFAFLALFGDMKRRVLLYIPLIIYFIDSYYLAFVLGLLLSDISFSPEYERIQKCACQKNWLSWALLFLGCLFIFFFKDDTNPLMSIMNGPFFSRNHIDPEVFYHIIGMACMMYAVIFQPCLQRLFNQKTLVLIGRNYSFALYLVHTPVICSLGAAVLLHFLGKGYAYSVSWGLAVIATFPLIALLTWVTYRYIDIPSGRFAKWIENKMFR